VNSIKLAEPASTYSSPITHFSHSLLKPSKLRFVTIFTRSPVLQSRAVVFNVGVVCLFSRGRESFW